MGRFLNIGIIQMPVSLDTAENLKYIEKRMEMLMSGAHRPELILGVECIASMTPEPIPGKLTAFFGALAKKYGVYLVPGTICESSTELPKGKYYNTAPIFNPKGELIDCYRKMVPWMPVENNIAPGNRYVVFEIPEKQTKIGVQICYDLCFPEISRNETLLGAEVLLKLTLDPQELYLTSRPIHIARAIENQAFLVSANGVGFHRNTHLYGHSIAVDPCGRVLWEAGESETTATVTLDLEQVRQARRFGTMYLDHYLQHWREYELPSPFAGRIAEAPLYETLERMPDTTTLAEYEENIRQEGLGELGRPAAEDTDAVAILYRYHDFLEKKKQEGLL